MVDSYTVSCDCGTVEMHLTGAPRVRGHCHRNACRMLLDTPYHLLTAWNPDQAEFREGSEAFVTFQHPELTMRKVFCGRCGEVLYNTNRMDWRVVSQHLLAKSLGELPEALMPLSHFHYASSIVDVADSLVKKD